MHRVKELSRGDVTTTCGQTVKKTEASIWESDITCEDCGIRWQLSLHEPSAPDKMAVQRAKAPAQRKTKKS